MPPESHLTMATGNLLDQLLYHQTPFRVREMALQVLMTLLDNVGDSAELFTVLGTALNFIPFCDQDTPSRLEQWLRQRSKAGTLSAHPPVHLVLSFCPRMHSHSMWRVCNH